MGKGIAHLPHDRTDERLLRTRVTRTTTSGDVILAELRLGSFHGVKVFVLRLVAATLGAVLFLALLLADKLLVVCDALSGITLGTVSATELL